MIDSRLRSLLKGVTWRFVASGTTMLIVLVATGDIVLMAGVGAADVVIKILFYYCHERIWGRVKWGKVGVEPQCK